MRLWYYKQNFRIFKNTWEYIFFFFSYYLIHRWPLWTNETNSYHFFLCVHFKKSHAMPPKSIRISKTCFSRQFQGAISQVSHHQPSCNSYGSDISRKCLWNATYRFENACSRKFHASVLSIKEFLNANGVASFSETATVLVELILVMPTTNASSERSYSGLRRIKNHLTSTMTQKRMNNLMLIVSVYKEDADNLNLRLSRWRLSPFVKIWTLFRSWPMLNI